MSNPYNNPYVPYHLSRIMATAINKEATTKVAMGLLQAMVVGTTKEATMEAITTPISQVIRVMDKIKEAIETRKMKMLLIAVLVSELLAVLVVCYPSAFADSSIVLINLHSK